MKTILVLHTFPVPLSDKALSDAVSRMKPCLQEYGVNWKRSYLAEDRLRMFCEYEAVDAESVRSACRSGDVPLDGVWQVDKIE
jgi:hypothetical protein